LIGKNRIFRKKGSDIGNCVKRSHKNFGGTRKPKIFAKKGLLGYFEQPRTSKKGASAHSLTAKKMRAIFNINVLFEFLK